MCMLTAVIKWSTFVWDLLGGSAIPSPPNTFQHAELPLNCTKNNHFHRGALFSMHLSRAMLDLSHGCGGGGGSGGPGGRGSWAQGLMGVNICISAICMWSEKTQGREPITHPRTPEEGVINAAYCFRAHFCTCEAHESAVTPFKLQATNKHKKMQIHFVWCIFKLCRSR